MWDLYLDSVSNGLARQGQPPIWEPHPNPAQGVVNGMTRLRAQQRGWLRPRVRVWLSGALARPFVMAQVAGLKGRPEAMALAAATASGATGLEPEPAPEIWLDGLPLTGPVVSVAMPRNLHQSVLDAAIASRVKLESLRPWWSAALSDALMQERDIELFAAQDTEAVTVLVAKDNAWLAADTYTPSPAGAQLEALVTRRLFASGVGPDAARRVRLDASASASTTWRTPRPATSFVDE
jgi:hypothetical protein